MSTTNENVGHTPGPWKYETSKFPGSRLVFAPYTGPLERTVHFVACNVAARHHLPSRHQEAEAEANARLIAAAPELLAACKAVIKEAYVSENHGEPPTAEMSADVLEVLRAAIAKAEGIA